MESCIEREREAENVEETRVIQVFEKRERLLGFGLNDLISFFSDVKTNGWTFDSQLEKQFFIGDKQLTTEELKQAWNKAENRKERD